MLSFLLLRTSPTRSAPCIAVVHAVPALFRSLYWSFPAILAPRRKSASWRRDEFRGQRQRRRHSIITGVILQVTGAI